MMTRYAERLASCKLADLVCGEVSAPDNLVEYNRRRWQYIDGAAGEVVGEFVEKLNRLCDSFDEQELWYFREQVINYLVEKLEKWHVRS